MISTETLEVALSALVTRVRWYETRSYRVPAQVGRAFNEIADALGRPDARPYKRVRMVPR